MKDKKIVKRKEVKYSLDEWKQIEARASEANLRTGTFIKRISLRGKINVIDLKKITDVMSALRIIGNNINQIARRANETGNIYENDILELKGEYESLCHILNQFLSTLPSTAA